MTRPLTFDPRRAQLVNRHTRDTVLLQRLAHERETRRKLIREGLWAFLILMPLLFGILTVAETALKRVDTVEQENLGG